MLSWGYVYGKADHKKGDERRDVVYMREFQS